MTSALEQSAFRNERSLLASCREASSVERDETQTTPLEARCDASSQGSSAQERAVGLEIVVEAWRTPSPSVF